MFIVRATKEQCEAIRSMCCWARYGREDVMKHFEQNSHVSLPEDCFDMLAEHCYGPNKWIYNNIPEYGPFEVLGRWFYLEDE